MPTYEYECGACGHRFEKFQSMTEAPVKKCPECAKPKVKRLISGGGGVIFKGTGFYQTDYKKSAGPKNDSKPSKSEGCGKPSCGSGPSCGSE